MNLRTLLSHYAEHAIESKEFELNEDFNKRLDDGDIEGYELILRKPDGEEQPVSPVSAALFVSDLPAYRQLVKDDIAVKRHEVLMLDDFPTNYGAYDKLLNLVRQRAAVVPLSEQDSRCLLDARRGRIISLVKLSDLDLMKRMSKHN